MKLSIKPKSVAFVAILPLLLFSTLNISHMEGMAGDFSNMVLELVTSNSSEHVDYSILQMERNSWIVVNVSVPEEDYSMNVLIGDDARPDLEGDLPIIEITYSDVFLPDFSNLHIHFVSSETSEEIGYTFVAVEEGQWAILGLDRLPSEDETISLFAEYPISHPAESKGTPEPEENESVSESGPDDNRSTLNESGQEFTPPQQNESNQSDILSDGPDMDANQSGNETFVDVSLPATNQSNLSNDSLFAEIPSDFSFELFGAEFKSDVPVLIKSNGAIGKALQKGKHDVLFTPPAIETKPGRETQLSPVIGIHFKQLNIVSGARHVLALKLFLLQQLHLARTPRRHLQSILLNLNSTMQQ